MSKPVRPIDRFIPVYSEIPAAIIQDRLMKSPVFWQLIRGVLTNRVPMSTFTYETQTIIESLDSRIKAAEAHVKAIAARAAEPDYRQQEMFP